MQIGFLGPALFLSQLSHVTTATGAVACMMASQGLDSFSQSGLYSNHQVCTLKAPGCACTGASFWSVDAQFFVWLPTAADIDVLPDVLMAHIGKLKWPCVLQDIGPRYSGVLLGMSNTAGVLAGVMGTAATGLILANGSWDDVWNVAVVLYLVGTVVWNVFATGEQIFD